MSLWLKFTIRCGSDFMSFWLKLPFDVVQTSCLSSLNAMSRFSMRCFAIFCKDVVFIWHMAQIYCEEFYIILIH